MPDVVWRSDVVRRNGILESPALEFHVVPVENLGRLPVLRLRDLAVELAETGRKAGTFTPAEQLTIEADASRALALGSGPSGLLVTRSGQRSMWHPLPSDTLGALLDEEWVAEQLERMIVVLRDLTLPVPDRWATAVGIAPAATVTPGKVSSIPRSRATFGFDRREVVRVPPDESVAPADLSHRAVAVAAELAARLVAAFG